MADELLVTLWWWFENRWVLIPHREVPDKLDAGMAYKIKISKMNEEFHFRGDIWDKSILTDKKSLSYWLGIHGYKKTITGLDIMAFHNGVVDGKSSN
jgi:hypothetical protein